MTGRVRIGVVGLGWVGTNRHIPAIRASARFELVGVADRDGAKAHALAAKLGVREGSGTRLGDIGWIDEVDAISVATAPMAHHDLVCEALARGLHVITEKPFAMTVGEGRAMVDTAEAAGRVLAVVHNFQFSRSMRTLSADLGMGRLGAVRGIRAVQLGNPRRRLPAWYEELPLGLFYDESPHLLYLMAGIAGPLELAKAVSVRSRRGLNTPAQVDAWFDAPGAGFPITMSCNFEAGLSEWHVAVHGENAVAFVDVFRDIYLRLPNDGGHGTLEVLRTSAAAFGQHWWQHLTSGIPHLAGKLRYGNDHVFDRFASAASGDVAALGPIDSRAALQTLALQHAIIDSREEV